MFFFGIALLLLTHFFRSQSSIHQWYLPCCNQWSVGHPVLQLEPTKVGTKSRWKMHEVWLERDGFNALLLIRFFGEEWWNIAIGETPNDYFEAYYLDCRMNPNDPNFNRLAKGLHNMFKAVLASAPCFSYGWGLPMTQMSFLEIDVDKICWNDMKCLVLFFLVLLQVHLSVLVNVKYFYAAKLLRCCSWQAGTREKAKGCGAFGRCKRCGVKMDVSLIF